MKDTKRMHLPIKAYRPIQSVLQCVITKRIPAVFPFGPHGVSCQDCRKQFVVVSNHSVSTRFPRLTMIYWFSRSMRLSKFHR